MLPAFPEIGGDTEWNQQLHQCAACDSKEFDAKYAEYGVPRFVKYKVYTVDKMPRRRCGKTI
jgi:hypothetical protein